MKALISLLFSFSLFSYEFSGKHFLASYTDCDPIAINDVQTLEKIMYKAVSSSGSTILDYSIHYFDGKGITIVYLLSESHASIHTYPEFNACFVDLFTCGTNTSNIPFDIVLQDYLKPKKVVSELKLRG